MNTIRKSPMYENQNGCSDPSWHAFKLELNLFNDQKSYLASYSTNDLTYRLYDKVWIFDLEVNQSWFHWCLKNPKFVLNPVKNDRENVGSIVYGPYSMGSKITQMIYLYDCHRCVKFCQYVYTLRITTLHYLSSVRFYPGGLS